MLVLSSRCHEFSPFSVLEAMRALWADPERRREEGEALLARARERHSEERYLRDLLDLYERVSA
jgi:glycosyltransferase involved in cell wall biosynthesis